MVDRWTRPYLLLIASLLLGGVVLTALNMLLVGWSTYALGHIGSIFAFILVAAAYRPRMDGWTS